MKIRNKVIVSITNNHQVLLSEGYDPSRDFKFYIPVGGGVEFGEIIHKAAERELFEELSVKDKNLLFLNFHESFFKLNGIDQHEIVFHYTCQLNNEEREKLPSHGTESGGDTFEINWFSKKELLKIQNNIVPPNIYDELQNIL